MLLKLGGLIIFFISGATQDFKKSAKNKPFLNDFLDNCVRKWGRNLVFK